MDADRLAANVGERSNLSAFLLCIRACEGTRCDLGYRALFGFVESRGAPVFDSFADHPNQRFTFRQTDGTVGFTTAAGAYQIIFATWKRVQTKLALNDFSPPSQDAAAVCLIEERKALDFVNSGAIELAIGRCWPVWASLPGSTYQQPSRSMQFAIDAYVAAGGILAGDD